jgi:tetratricopeptide (TPR) repeat protein
MQDKLNLTIQQLIEKEQPKSIEDLQKLLNTLVGKTLDELPFIAQNDAQKAVEMVWEAWELSPDKGKQLTQKALELHPDCIEAHEYMGESYSYYDKRAIHFQKGVEIGRRIFGGAFLKENKGYFWGVSETRPFMRCLSSLANCHYSLLGCTEAIEIWKEMLELNPNDNQGIRFNLFPALLETNNLKDFKKYRKKHTDGSSMMLFNDALAEFMEKGACESSNVLLQVAANNNKFVRPLLLATYPPKASPATYTLNSPEEAVIYVHSAWRAWLRAKGAKDWLKNFVK